MKLVAGNPVILDSGDTGVVVSDSRAFVEKISFVGDTVGDVCTLSDNDGNVIFDAKWSGAGADRVTEDFHRHAIFNGLVLTSLTGAGKCYVYFY